MNAEELLSAKLLSTFTAYKQRQASNMIAFYGDRLRDLEDALLETRHQVMELQVCIGFADLSDEHFALWDAGISVHSVHTDPYTLIHLARIFQPDDTNQKQAISSAASSRRSTQLIAS